MGIDVKKSIKPKVHSIYLSIAAVILLPVSMLFPISSQASTCWAQCRNSSTGETYRGGSYDCNSVPSINLCSSGGNANGISGNGNVIDQQNNAAVLGITILSTMIMQNANNNQAEEARRKVEDAAQQAELKRQAQAQARRDEEAKQQLLGGPNSGNSSGLSLMGVTQTSSLQLMTGDQVQAPMATGSNQNSSKNMGTDQVKHSDAFDKGYHDGSLCFSQNAGPYCSGLAGATWQTCLDDYRSGYEVGTNEMKMKVSQATRLGRLDAESGKPNNGFNDSNSVGDCRVQLNEAYDRGYSQR